MDLIDTLSCENWLNDPKRCFLRKKITVTPGFTAPYFLSVHAATEASFRQLQFIGLRMHRVTYKNGQDWLFHNDSTPSNDVRAGSFQNNFSILFRQRLGNWVGVLDSNEQLRCAWELWVGFSKHIRNHIAHGVRGYPDTDLERALAIDFALMVELEYLLAPYIGGGLYSRLDQLLPRLPRGDNKVDVATLLKIKKPRKPRPKISSSLVDSRLSATFSLPLMAVMGKKQYAK